MRRILLKLSGEALAGDKKHGFDEETVRKVAAQIAEVVKGGVQVGVVIGGATSGGEEPARTWTGRRRIRSVCWPPS